jgi:integrase
VAEITDDDVHAALEKLASEPAMVFAGKVDGVRRMRPRGQKSTSTVNRYHACLGSVLKFAARKRLLPRGWKNPSHQVERSAETPGRIRFLSDAERQRLLAICKVSRWPRLYVLVLMALTTAARKSELLGLHWQDVDLERAQAYVATTKNGEPRVLPLTATVIAELRKFTGRPEELLFPSTRRPDRAMDFQKHWESALKQARIDNFRFHDCRHSCASYLAQQGASLVELADVLGHRTMAMVRRYSHLSTESKTKLVNRVLGDMK